MRLLLPFIFFAATLSAKAKPPESDSVSVLSDIAYKTGDALTDYEKERCKLDVYLPKDAKDFPTVVWFHGGGLKSGSKGKESGDNSKEASSSTPKIARSLAADGIAVVAVNYRLSPKATYPAYIEDAAAAVAWTHAHISEHGGDAKKLFISGHSAGGYLTLMLGMDPHYLSAVGVQPADIAGLIPLSGQTMTHYTVREERGIGKYNVTADEAAPVFFTRKDTPPFLVLYADHDMAARAEENAFFVALMKGAGNKVTEGLLIQDRTHGSIAGKIVNDGDPARVAILKFIRGEK
jgi:acetyl esterase/lipase